MAKKYTPVSVDKRCSKHRPVGEAWDFEGRTFRFSHRSGGYSIDSGEGGRPPSKWTHGEWNSFDRFQKLAEDKRKKHRRCRVCRENPAWPQSLMCNKCRFAQRGLIAEPCVVEGCENPRRKSGGWESDYCTLHHRENQAKEAADRAARKAAEKNRRDPDEYDGPQMYSSVPKSKSVQPYNWRNCRPGSMSEALRIDAGGQQ